MSAQLNAICDDDCSKTDRNEIDHDKTCKPKCKIKSGYFQDEDKGYDESKGLTCENGALQRDETFTCHKMLCTCPNGKPRDPKHCTEFDGMVDCEDCDEGYCFAAEFDQRKENGVPTNKEGKCIVAIEEGEYVQPMDQKHKKPQKQGQWCKKSKWTIMDTWDKAVGSAINIGVPTISALALFALIRVDWTMNTLEEEREEADMWAVKEKEGFCGNTEHETQCESLRKVEEQWWRANFTDFSTAPPSTKDGKFDDFTTYLK